MKVLVVDDDPDQVSVRRLLLEHMGFETIQAVTAAAALLEAERVRPEIAVLDLNLPKAEHGLELVRNLKTLNPSMKIYVLTGRSSAYVMKQEEARLIEGVFLKGMPARAWVDRLKALTTS